MLLLLLSRFSHVRLCVTPQTAAHQAPPSLDTPGKNTGVDCHFFLQCVKVKSESEVVQSCPTLSDPTDCSPPGSCIHGILQARVLEWGAIYVCVYIYIYKYNVTAYYLLTWPEIYLLVSFIFYCLFTSLSLPTSHRMQTLGYKNHCFISVQGLK